MHHPGPPRFTAVGQSVELAPRRPDAADHPENGDGATGATDAVDAADFDWSIRDAPTGSSAALDPGHGAGAVVHLAPDEPGRYRLELDAPDGRHELLVRAFPDPRRTARFAVDTAELPAPPEEATPVSLVGPFNGFRLGVARPTIRGEELVYETRLPPGTHEAAFLPDDDFDRAVDADATVPGPGRPRVSLDATVEEGTVVVRADASAAPADPAELNGDPASGAEVRVEFYLDGRDGLVRERVAVDGSEVRLPRDALPAGDDPVRLHAVAVAEHDPAAVVDGADGTGFESSGGGVESAIPDDESPPTVRHSVPDTVEIGGGGRTEGRRPAVERPTRPPGWVRDATIYEVFVRSFCGDTPDTTFAELERRVEYVDSLGVDTVWLTPVVASPTRHGYHVTDYFDTAADLGSLAAFESFVDACHDRGIRVVFDLVINHTSRDHPAFQLHRAGVEGYEDHYLTRDGDRVVDGVEWAGGDAPDYYFDWTRIPNLNYDSLDVRAWMLHVVEEWASVVDGFRCDVAWGVPHGFWKEVRERVTAENPAFLLLDETLPRDPEYDGDEFDLHYDTALYHTLRDVGRGDADADALFAALADERWQGFPEAAVGMRYVENHDEERYLDDCGAPALRAAAAVTLTLPGAPMVYAGQERGMTEYRGPMRWHDGDAALTDWHRTLTGLRNERPTLRRGRVDPIDTDDDRVVAYRRTLGDGGEEGIGDGAEDAHGDLLVVCNFGAAERTVELAPEHGTTDLLTGEDASDDGEVVVADAVVLDG